MEHINMCLKILYDKDICDKMNEITSLKEDLKTFITPKIIFNSYKEWHLKISKIYKVIKKCIDKYIVEEHSHSQGLTYKQQQSILNCLYEEFNILTNNKKWSLYKSNQIISGLNSMCYGLIKAKLWDNFYNTYTPQDFANIIYNNISWQLENDDVDNEEPIRREPICGEPIRREPIQGILVEITHFKCNKCNEIYNWNLICIPHYSYLPDNIEPIICYNCENN